MNNSEKLKIEKKNLSPAWRKSSSLYCRIKTIIQKYALSPSATNNGVKTVHHDVEAMTFSCFRTASTEKIKIDTRWIQISNTVIPNHLTTSFSVKNMFTISTNNLVIKQTFCLDNVFLQNDYGNPFIVSCQIYDTLSYIILHFLFLFMTLSMYCCLL